MQTSLCPFCLKFVQDSRCPYCGNDINYPGYPNHLPVGCTLTGRSSYILGAALGQGGFGITYIAMDAIAGTRLAIKEYYPNHCCGRTKSTHVLPSYGQEDTFSQGKNHFIQEAQMLQSLSDLDSVVNVVDYFEANSTAYLVMEFLEGRSLKDHVIQTGKMPAQLFLHQIGPMMADIEKMHSRGVIHRDIAPDNIILLNDGRLKLIDFGAARSYVGDKSMTVVVKKGFAPVEQYMRKGSSACTDVYALAATIYYCITGIVPPDSAERQYGDAAMTAPSMLGADLMPVQEAALERALELQPRDRIQTVAELSAMLLSAATAPPEQDRRQQKKASAYGSDAFQPEDGKPPRQKKAPSAQRQKQPGSSRKAAYGIAAAAAALILVCGGFWGVRYFRYSSAAKGMDSGDYEKAYAAFSSLGDFQESSEKAKAAKYAQGTSLMEAGQYQEAALAFDAAAGYLDSVEKAALCRKEAAYQSAESLFAQGRYLDAYNAFSTLGSHADSASRAEESGYLYAGEQAAAKNYHEAYTMYSKFPDFKDSFTLGQEAEYQYALSCAEANRYPEGIEAFTNIKTYRDSAEKCRQLQYDYAEQMMSTSQWESAVTLYATLKDYADSADRLLEAKYMYVRSHPEKTDALTVEYLNDLNKVAYKDVQTLYEQLFGWHAVLTAVNTNPADGNTILNSVPMNTNYLHFRFLLTGGTPTQSVDLFYKILWPNGVEKLGKSEWKNASDGYYLDCCWDHGLFEDLNRGQTGELKVQVYTKGSNQFIGEGSVMITG